MRGLAEKHLYIIDMVMDYTSHVPHHKRYKQHKTKYERMKFKQYSIIVHKIICSSVLSENDERPKNIGDVKIYIIRGMNTRFT